jgi:hypothetical protein
MRMMLFIPLILMLVAAGGQDENAAYNFVDQDGLFKAVKKTGGEKAYTPYDSFSIIISQGDKRFVIDNNDYEVRLESSPFKIICVLEDNQVIRLNISEKYKTIGDWIKSADFYLIKTLRFKIRFDGNP